MPHGSDWGFCGDVSSADAAGGVRRSRAATAGVPGAGRSRIAPGLSNCRLADCGPARSAFAPADGAVYSSRKLLESDPSLKDPRSCLRSFSPSPVSLSPTPSVHSLSPSPLSSSALLRLLRRRIERPEGGRAVWTEEGGGAGSSAVRGRGEDGSRAGRGAEEGDDAGSSTGRGGGWQRGQQCWARRMASSSSGRKMNNGGIRTNGGGHWSEFHRGGKELGRTHGQVGFDFFLNLVALGLVQRRRLRWSGMHFDFSSVAHQTWRRPRNNESDGSLAKERSRGPPPPFAAPVTSPPPSLPLVTRSRVKQGPSFQQIVCFCRVLVEST
ncbi:hypothetical protein PVAP13_1KG221505 [Panicum virgatum]|uniref:Uncharacterized protein n=1 Tax=Panicum virgatum TaxID=38727 RepID=A0A8T0XRT2_PANVG|nr:hypothetical protein PVAP13_1KG221505 [Panicum virgatum]